MHVIGMSDTRRMLQHLYFGQGRRAAAFQYGLLLFDLAVISFFVGVSFAPPQQWLVWVDLGLAVVLGAEFGLRLWIAERRGRFVLQFTSLADLVVIVSLLMPALTESYAFLRILRVVRLLRSYYVLGLLCQRFTFAKRNYDVIISILNLIVFVFFMTATVYVTQVRDNPQIENYIDALYFTVTAMTTTGFGDIILEGTGGKLLAVLIMMFGISLFVRLAQTVFRPAKVHFECPTCGLTRHDPDAVHCKHCGTVLHIPTEGAI